MKTRLLCAALLLAAPAFGQQAYPALHDVKGVASNDVLNIRAEPNAAAPILGSFSADQTAIEIVALDPNAKWGRVNAGEVSGWVSMAYLSRRAGADWYEMQDALDCSGTEPFWGAVIDPRMANAMQVSSPDNGDQTLNLVSVWPGTAWRAVAGVTFAAADTSGMAVIRAEACSDGMSDRAYGLTIDLFLDSIGGGDSKALRGCCVIAP